VTMAVPIRRPRAGRRGARSLVPLAASLFLVTNLQAQTEIRMPDSTPHFPAVTGRSLTGRTYHLPADFEGERNLVLVAFKRHQQEDVDTWTPHLRPLAARDSTLRAYELPTLGHGYTWMRGFIDGGMRRGIPDSAVRAATITLYINKRSFRDTLAIADENRIHVLLVDRAGRILWRAEGPYTAEAEAALKRVLGP